MTLAYLHQQKMYRLDLILQLLYIFVFHPVLLVDPLFGIVGILGLVITIVLLLTFQLKFLCIDVFSQLGFISLISVIDPNIKLMHYTFYDQVEDVRKALCTIGCPWKVHKPTFQLINHLVITQDVYLVTDPKFF